MPSCLFRIPLSISYMESVGGRLGFCRGNVHYPEWYPVCSWSLAGKSQVEVTHPIW